MSVTGWQRTIGIKLQSESASESWPAVVSGIKITLEHTKSVKEFINFPALYEHRWMWNQTKSVSLFIAEDYYFTLQYIKWISWKKIFLKFTERVFWMSELYQNPVKHFGKTLHLRCLILDLHYCKSLFYQIIMSREYQCSKPEAYLGSCETSIRDNSFSAYAKCSGKLIFFTLRFLYGGKKYNFFVKFRVRTKWMIPNETFCKWI